MVCCCCCVDEELAIHSYGKYGDDVNKSFHFGTYHLLYIIKYDNVILPRVLYLFDLIHGYMQIIIKGYANSLTH